MIRRLTTLLLFLAPPPAWAVCGPVASRAPSVVRVAETGVTVHIAFLGHASFLIETPGHIRAVTDYSGAFAPNPPPDLVTMNHAHTSHFTLSPEPRIRVVLHGWQEGPSPPHHDVTLGDLHVRNIPTNIRTWAGGTEINGNSIFVFETAGLCIAHLGHLHHLLEQADLDALGLIDIAMVPVDGSWTLGQADAKTAIGQMHPRIVLPMHYFTFDNLARFLDLMRDTYEIEIAKSPDFDVSRATLPDRPTVMALLGPH